MPEGPSIVILRELVESLHLEGKSIIAVEGNTKIEKERMLQQKVIRFKSWGELNSNYDWSSDVMAAEWDDKKAVQKIRKKPDELICDVLLDQQIFSGVGNIIKNEVLYRTGIHPLCKIGAIPLGKLKLLVVEARQYSFDFLKWKKAYVLKKHWLVHTKKFCPLEHPLEKAYLGKTKRRTFFCVVCQKLYSKHKSP